MLHSVLRDQLPREANGQTELQLPEGATASEVLKRLGLSTSMWYSVNGMAASSRDQLLQDGDVVAVFTRLGGG